jgi:integrase
MQMKYLDGAYYCYFWHPLTKKTKCIRLGADEVQATTNFSKLVWLKDHQEHWRNPPGTLPEVVLRAWGSGEAGPSAVTKLTPGSFSPELVKKLIHEIREREKIISRQHAELVALRGSMYDLPELTVEEAVEQFLDTYTGSVKQVRNVKTILNRFARDWKVQIKALKGKESNLRSWIDGLKMKPGGKNQYRIAILMMLDRSGLKLDRDEIKPWTEDDPYIRWLSREEAVAVRDQLTGEWREAWQIQVGTGMRPSEMPTIERADLDGDMLTIRSKEGRMTAKTGSRTIKVPPNALAALKRQLSKHNCAFVSDKYKQAYKTQEAFYKWYSRALDQVTGTPFALDLRTARRTCGSLMIRQRHTVDEVAAYLGSSPEIIRRHYARILPHEVSGAAADI